MDELKAEIRDPGTGETHKKEETTAHHEEVLPPVIGVGWEDEDVVILRAEDLKAQKAKSKGTKKGPKLPTPVTAVTMMEGWEAIVGWKEIIASYEHILAEAEAQVADAPPEAATPAKVSSTQATQAKPAPKAQESAPAPAPSAPTNAQPKAAAVASSAWKPAPAAEAKGASPWKPAKAATSGGSAWKPSAGAKASPWKPPAQDKAPDAPPAPQQAKSTPTAPTPPAPRQAQASPKAAQGGAPPHGDNLPPDTLKKVAVLMRKGDIAKSKRVLELWLKTRPTDIVGLKMLAICEQALKAKDVSAKAARIPRPKVPGPDPRAIPRVDMTKLMGAGDSLSPKDAFILSRIDGHTRVEQLNHLVPELSQEELTGLLVRSWKAGIVSFKR